MAAVGGLLAAPVCRACAAASGMRPAGCGQQKELVLISRRQEAGTFAGFQCGTARVAGIAGGRHA
jgi:hypothetical protein